MIDGHKGWGSYGDVFPFGGEGPRDSNEGPRGKRALDEDDECPSCGGLLVIRTNRATGVRFLGCSDFKNGCRFSAELE